MSNCKSDGGLNHHWVDASRKDDIYNSLYSLLECDNDLTENEDFFRDDTLSLGYESEAERIVKEALEKHGYPRDINNIRNLYKDVANHIIKQGYFGNCELSVIAINLKIVSIAFTYGGNDD
jgi:hypothetical protein